MRLMLGMGRGVRRLRVQDPSNFVNILSCINNVIRSFGHPYRRAEEQRLFPKGSRSRAVYVPIFWIYPSTTYVHEAIYTFDYSNWETNWGE